MGARLDSLFHFGPLNPPRLPLPLPRGHQAPPRALLPPLAALPSRIWSPLPSLARSRTDWRTPGRALRDGRSGAPPPYTLQQVPSRSQPPQTTNRAHGAVGRTILTSHIATMRDTARLLYPTGSATTPPRDDNDWVSGAGGAYASGTSQPPFLPPWQDRRVAALKRSSVRRRRGTMEASARSSELAGALQHCPYLLTYPPTQIPPSVQYTPSLRFCAYTPSLPPSLPPFQVHLAIHRAADTTQLHPAQNTHNRHHTTLNTTQLLLHTTQL